MLGPQDSALYFQQFSFYLFCFRRTARVIKHNRKIVHEMNRSWWRAGKNRRMDIAG